MVNTVIPIHEKDGLYIETVPWACPVQVPSKHHWWLVNDGPVMAWCQQAIIRANAWPCSLSPYGAVTMSNLTTNHQQPPSWLKWLRCDFDVLRIMLIGLWLLSTLYSRYVGRSAVCCFLLMLVSVSHHYDIIEWKKICVAVPFCGDTTCHWWMDSPHKGTMTRTFVLTNCWTNIRLAGNSRRSDGHLTSP